MELKKNWLLTLLPNPAVYMNTLQKPLMFKSKLTPIAIIPFILCALLGCSQPKNQFEDKRDGIIYRTVTIGDQTWMAENLNFKISDSWCYADSQSNCDKYGRLYTWQAALKACPEGWHLPSEDEWRALESYLGMSEEQIDTMYMRGDGMGTKLKKVNAWESAAENKSEYDILGFNALPGGFRLFIDGSFVDKGIRGSWWTSTPDGQYAMRRSIFRDKTGIDRDAATVTNAFSVRCIKDNKSKKNSLKQESENLKIISYNVWYGFTKVPERKKAWIAWMNEQGPDIVSLQELNEYTHEKLAEDAKSYGHSYSALLKEEGFPTGITSRYPIEDIKISTEGFHHGLLRVRIKGIYIYIIHLHPSNWETRKNEITQILENIDGLPPDSQVILAGDFNTFSPLDSTYYSHGRLEPFFHDRDSLYNEKNLNNGKLDYSVIQEVMDFGLIDLEASSRTSSYNFSGSFPTLVEKEGEHGDQRRLDYVFASKNLADKLGKANIIATDTTLILSDHLPVVIEFCLDK